MVEAAAAAALRGERVAVVGHSFEYASNLAQRVMNIVDVKRFADVQRVAEVHRVLGFAVSDDPRALAGQPRHMVLFFDHRALEQVGPAEIEFVSWATTWRNNIPREVAERAAELAIALYRYKSAASAVAAEGEVSP